MANAFKNKLTKNVGTTEVGVYTAGTSVTATLIGLSVANTNSTSTVSVTVNLVDMSTSTTCSLATNTDIPVGSTLVVVGGDQKVVLEESDEVSVVSDLTSSLDVVVSILEQT